jgi:uncharacterized membrane protein
MLDLSHLIWTRYALTEDFAQAEQAWWALGRGHFDPYDSVASHPYWHDHGAFLFWPFALIFHVVWDGYATLAVQDVLVVAAEVIAFVWILELLRESDFGLPLPNWTIGASALLLLVANPWFYWAVAFDFHPDVMMPTPFVVLALRALYYRRYRQLAFWALLILLSGDVATTYVAIIGVTGLLISVLPGERRIAASIALIFSGAAGFFIVSHLDGGTTSTGILQNVASTSTSTESSPLIAGFKLILHPWHLLASPIHQFRNIWAFTSPAGLLGLLSLWSLPFAVAIAIENSAGGLVFSAGAFQYIAIWAPLAVGGVFSARYLSRRRWGRIAATALVVVSVLNTVGWAVIWLPKTDDRWVRVDPGAAHVLDQAEHLIPADAEVIASQGIIGRFADRDVVYAFPGNFGNEYPVSRHEVYAVISAYQGIELGGVNQALGLLGNLAGPVGAKLVLHGHGIWVFRLTSATASGIVDLSAGYDSTAVPVWASHTSTGHPTFEGPSDDWTMTTTSRAGGYLLYGAYYRKPLGDYVLQVRLATTGSANVEAWNENANLLIGRRAIPATNGIKTVDVPVSNLENYPPQVYRGHVPFSQEPAEPPPGEVIEARVYLPPQSTGTVYSVRLIQVSA